MVACCGSPLPPERLFWPPCVGGDPPQFAVEGARPRTGTPRRARLIEDLRLWAEVQAGLELERRPQEITDRR
jgi:hypothetical protein